MDACTWSGKNFENDSSTEMNVFHGRYGNVIFVVSAPFGLLRTQSDNNIKVLPTNRFRWTFFGVYAAICDDGLQGGCMHIGETVEAMVNGGQWCNGQVIAIYKDSVTVSGEA